MTIDTGKFGNTEIVLELTLALARKVAFARKIPMQLIYIFSKRPSVT